MDHTNSIKNIMLKYIENISRANHYDFLYDDEDGKLLCQIIYRDNDGSILATPLSFHLLFNQNDDSGEIIYYHSKGEFKRQKFSIYEQESLVNILLFIQERLNMNSTNY